MTIGKLIWDVWNINHIARHNVIPEEVEEVCDSREVYISKSRNHSFRIIGQTLAGRYLLIILGYRDSNSNSYYVLTARDATKSERRLYKRK